ncbi:non-specific lipid transfer protein GPI-anchored 7-like [Nicotiana tomentosiformis]|uniref:non-specific lipid transfer protein GPI-anchored 7-like n=1 Tax=Nicotiana tomentosiformis TaxID=4098 RepID=UPI00051B30A3|nr:lipid transfer-like protein VAS [Nicotiana tomentosiformis]
MFSSKMSALITVVVTVAIMAATVAEAQTPSCAAKLVPCAPYLNSTKPPAECCDPLKEAITNELDCLCKLYENPTVLPSFGINITQALALPKACNIPGDLSSCNGNAAPGPGSETLPPPATPGGKNDSNGVNKIAWTGTSSLFVLFASLVLA